MDYRNKRLVSQYRTLLTHHEQDLVAVINELKTKWRSTSPKAESSSETMYQLGKQDGKCEALDLLYQEINNIASGQHD